MLIVVIINMNTKINVIIVAHKEQKMMEIRNANAILINVLNAQVKLTIKNYVQYAIMVIIKKNMIN